MASGVIKTPIPIEFVGGCYGAQFYFNNDKTVLYLNFFTQADKNVNNCVRVRFHTKDNLINVQKIANGTTTYDKSVTLT